MGEYCSKCCISEGFHEENHFQIDLKQIERQSTNISRRKSITQRTKVKKINHTRNLSTQTSLHNNDFSDLDYQPKPFFIGETDSFVIQRSYDDILVRENLIFRGYQGQKDSIIQRLNDNHTEIGSLRTTSNPKNCKCPNGCDQKKSLLQPIKYKITDQDRYLLQIDDISELKSFDENKNALRV